MSFDNPRALFFLLLLFPLALVMFLRRRGRRNGAGLFAGAAGAEERKILVRKFLSRIFYSNCFFALFFASCIIALAGPRWGEEMIPDYRRGVDVVFALDISRSMGARDCPPLPGAPLFSGTPGGSENSSRVERAFYLAREIGLGMEGMRAGAAAGKGRGILALPLSYDLEALMNFLSGAGASSLTGAGTNLESLLNAAAGAFKDNMPGRRVILLFSDGETLSGSLETAVNLAREKEIVICAAGFGTDEGGTVPVSGGVLLSEDGVPVISARKSEVLMDLASKTGGIYADGNLSGAAAALGNHFRSLAADSGQMGRRVGAKSRTPLFIVLALAALGASRILGFRRRGKTIAHAKTASRVFTLVLFGASFFSSCTPARGKLFIMEGNFHHTRGSYTEAVSAYLEALDYPDSTPYAAYGLGSAYFSLEENAAALERYKSAEENLEALPRERHTELRFRLKYNSGIIYFEQGDFERAARTFREALEIDGSRIEAKKNLELSLLSLVTVSGPQASSSQDIPEAEDSGGGSPVLLDFLRAREREQWRSTEWIDDSEYSGPDY